MATDDYSEEFEELAEDIDYEFEQLEKKLKAGVKPSKLDYDLGDIRDDAKRLTPKQRQELKAYALKKYPLAFKALGWKP